MTLLIYNKILNPNKIIKYTIYGERHSGTKLIESLMRNNTGLSLTWEYGWKHWFGFTGSGDILNANDTLFIGVVRNPYDWILSFFKEPHHVPKCNRSKLHQFLFNQWYSVVDPIFDTSEITIDRNFLSNQRYDNIFDLRKHKIYYLRQIMPLICNNYILISYEQLISNTKNIIKHIQQILNLSSNKCVFRIKSPTLYNDIDNIDHIINVNIDWNVERTIGYIKKC